MSEDIEYIDEPWLRQPFETAKQYEAFESFLFQPDDEAMSSLEGFRSHWYRWSSDNKWNERKAHYKNHLSKLTVKQHTTYVLEAKNKFHEYAPKAAETIIEIMMDEDTSNRDRLSAAREVLKYVALERVAEKVTIINDNSTAKDMTDDEIDQSLKRLLNGSLVVN